MNGKWVKDMPTCSNGAACADFDNDGDIDLVVNNSGGGSFIYKNNAREQGLGNYIEIKLHGPEKNPLGIGAKIVVRQTNQNQVLEQYLTRGFLSSGSPVLHVGLGSDVLIPEIDILWPDGKEQIITKIKVNQTIIVEYGNADQNHSYAYSKPVYFDDVTDELKLNHKHEEDIFNDFEKESMLPHKMSDLGPALAIADVNSDGLEDFYIGGARGFQGKLYLQRERGFISAGNQPWAEDKNCEDVKAVFFDADKDGDPDLYVVSGSNEYETGSAFLQDRLYLNTGSGNFKKLTDALPELKISGSCVEAHDYDSDGDADLFIGSRQRPGQYPLHVSSHLLRNDSKNGIVRFTDVTTEVAPTLADAGMVTDAVFTDVNGDQKSDLVIVGEWMNVTVLVNNKNKFDDISDKSGLSLDKGWWNCILSADFDHDGDMDLVAGNLGLNYNYKASKIYPFELFAKDFDNNGRLDLVFGYYQNDTLYPLHGLKSSASQLPFIKQKYQTHDSYARATLSDVYGPDNLKGAVHVKATNFASCYLENKGDGTYEIEPLPDLAQISSVCSIITEDIDSDGNPDLIIAGNMFGSEPEIPRNDAGKGLFMKGDGSGNFTPVPAYAGGLIIDGDVREISIIHLGKNKNRGLITAKNSGHVRIFKIGE